ncbi:MAG: TrkH family potassium uptake protein [Alphaproteobacteria bacterium]|nr:TrkH family potassium uptake protein [Alphaproteobacteria bacterium]
MSEYVKTILRDLGVAIHVPGAMALISLLVCLIAEEPHMLWAFSLCALVSLALGQGLYWWFREAGAMQVRHAMDTAVLAWVVIAILGMLPFLIGAYLVPEGKPATQTLLAFRDPWSALFESVSGFTSTGLSMAKRPEDLPKSLIWWRSFMQWTGGVGIIVVMLSVFHPAQYAYRLYFAEARERTIMSDVVETVATIWWIYLLFTVVAVVALHLAGMSWWHALNYGLTGIATGGFGATNGNIGDFGSGPRLVLLVIIICGAISFASHYRLLVKGQLSIFWKDRESCLLFALLIVGATLLALENRWYSGQWQWFESVFHWASALCTAGFQAASLDQWSPTARLLLTAGMVIGGVAGSTAGGLKLYRIVLLAEGASDRIVRMARQPWRIVGHQSLGDEEEAKRRRHTLEAATILMVLWLVVLGIGTLALAHIAGREVSLAAALLETASALGNVGLSSGITAPELPASGKAVLILLMWMGRLEIVPILVLFAGLRPRTRHHD